jgi:uncharacterized repeat protein (TIGR03803 family)
MIPAFKRSLCVAGTFIIASFSTTQGQHSMFYGMTAAGGKYNCGTVFKMDRRDGKIKVIEDFKTDYEGRYPCSDLCLANNGRFYGMTNGGGEYDLGILFEWDPVTQIFKKEVDFNGAGSGARPLGSLIKAKNGKLYGMNSEGGLFNKGVLFEWDPETDLFVKKLDFQDDVYRRGIGDLMQADNGKFYGLNYGFGSIFEWDPSTNVYSIKFNFDEYTTGYFPYGRLTQAGNGKLYGVAEYGGPNQLGTIYAWDPVTGVFNVITGFNNSDRFGYPGGSLVLADNGKLYGLSEDTYYTDDALFELDPNTGGITKKLDFSYYETGQEAHGSLVKGHNGKLYGMTWEGGAHSRGLLFEWDPVTDLFSKKVDFPDLGVSFYITPNLLSQASDDRFYGMYKYGGRDDSGFLFEWDTTSTVLTEKFSFNYAPDGRSPEGDLVLAVNGKLYGMTSYGGLNNDGVLFEIDTASGACVKKFDFKEDTTGANPSGSLMVAGNGNLYGMTDIGGKNNDGVLFEWDPFSNGYSVRSEFDERDNGMGPKSHLTEGSNHKFFGVTTNGGIYYYDGRGGYYSYGVLFEWDPSTSLFSKKHDFGNGQGILPSGTPLEVFDGKFYGMTREGGSNGGGVIYAWDPLTKTYSVKHDFLYLSRPCGSLMQAGNGKLYGMTTGDGVYSKGVLFEFDPVKTAYTVKLDFDGIGKGANPNGSLIQGSNGKLYGMTKSGGSSDNGVLFEWDPATEQFVKLLDFAGSDNGSSPYGSLLEISQATADTLHAEACKSFIIPGGRDTLTTSGIYKEFLTGSKGNDSILTVFLTIKSLASHIHVAACNNYSSPSGRYIWTISGEYKDTIPNAAGCDSVIFVNLTVNSRSFSEAQVSACHGYASPSGKYTWTTSGVYHDTIPNTSGCDSVITVDLQVDHADTAVVQDRNVLVSGDVDAGHQWIDCDHGNTPIEGETCQTYTAPINGRYAVIVSQGVCIDTSAAYEVVGTGMRDPSGNWVTLYPNPTSGKFTIDLGRVYTRAAVTITRYDGQVIRKENIRNKQKIDMDLDVLPGMYMIIISTENGESDFKIVKN